MYNETQRSYRYSLYSTYLLLTSIGYSFLEAALHLSIDKYELSKLINEFGEIGTKD